MPTSLALKHPISCNEAFGFLKAKLMPKTNVLQGWKLLGVLQCSLFLGNFEFGR